MYEYACVHYMNKHACMCLCIYMCIFEDLCMYAGMDAYRYVDAWVYGCTDGSHVGEDAS